MSVTSTPKGSDLELDALEAVARRAEAASEDGWLSPLSPEGEDLWNELDPPTILSLISAARKGQGEWRGIESAPSGTSVLIWRPSELAEDSVFAATYDEPDRRWTVTDGKAEYGLRGRYPTHWMPLPEPPK